MTEIRSRKSRQSKPGDPLLANSLVKMLEGDVPGVRVVNHPTRFGLVGEKRSAAIEILSGDVIAIWDDDLSLPWHLRFSPTSDHPLGRGHTHRHAYAAR